MELRDLAVFQAVARSGSMSRAAALVGLAQPTVSARIRDLEIEHGGPLFDRLGHGVRPTARGRRLLAYADRILALAEEAGRATRSPHAAIRLTTSASYAEAVLPAAIAALRERGVAVTLSTNHSPQVVEAVLDGRADAGVVVVATPLPGLASAALAEVRLTWVARAGAFATRRVSLREIVPRLAIFEWGDGVEDLYEGIALALAGRPAYPKVSPASVARRLVLDHGAVSVLPEPLVAADVRAGTLVELDVADLPEYRWRPRLVHRPRDRGSGAVAGLQELLGGSARGDPTT